MSTLIIYKHRPILDICKIWSNKIFYKYFDLIL